jgi:hypothetical protein
LRGKRNDKRAGIYALEKTRREYMQQVEKEKTTFFLKKSRKYKTDSDKRRNPKQNKI